jgi:hypothetical protein
MYTYCVYPAMLKDPSNLSKKSKNKSCYLQKMFSPVESQVIFLSKETPIISVGLRTAEVPYTNQNKTAWKSEGLKSYSYTTNKAKMYS